MLEIPCFKPADCPDSGLTCCVSLVERERVRLLPPQIACLGEGTYVACATDADCPFTNPTCNNFGQTPERRAVQHLWRRHVHARALTGAGARSTPAAARRRA